MAGTRSRLGLIPEDRWRTPQLEVPTRSPPLEDSLFLAALYSFWDLSSLTRDGTPGSLK